MSYKPTGQSCTNCKPFYLYNCTVLRLN